MATKWRVFVWKLWLKNHLKYKISWKDLIFLFTIRTSGSVKTNISIYDFIWKLNDSSLYMTNFYSWSSNFDSLTSKNFKSSMIIISFVSVILNISIISIIVNISDNRTISIFISILLSSINIIMWEIIS